MVLLSTGEGYELFLYFPIVSRVVLTYFHVSVMPVDFSVGDLVFFGLGFGRVPILDKP